MLTVATPFTMPDNVIMDHLAIAVKDLEQGIAFYTQFMGFKLIERRSTQGAKSGMISAVLGGPSSGFTIVLLQGTSEQSQVSRYVEQYGAGVQHAAFLVDDLEQIATALSEAGLTFATDIIRGPDLNQLFTCRDENSGMMYEFIERVDNKTGFEPDNIQQLFEDLESSDAF